MTDREQIQEELVDFMLQYPVNPKESVPNERIMIADFILKKTKDTVPINLFKEHGLECYDLGYLRGKSGADWFFLGLGLLLGVLCGSVLTSLTLL